MVLVESLTGGWNDDTLHIFSVLETWLDIIPHNRIVSRLI